MEESKAEKPTPTKSQREGETTLFDSLKKIVGLNEDQKNLAGYSFIAPNLIIFTFFLFLPAAFTFVISLFEWNILTMNGAFIGIDNYIDIYTPLPWANNWAPLRSPTVNTWWFALKNTVVFTVGVVPGQIYGGLMVALLLDSRVKGQNMFRAIYFLPIMISGAVSATIWWWTFSPNGAVNGLLRPLGLAHNWVGDPGTALGVLLLVGIWMGVGFNMVVFLAGLQNIPEALYQAARIDGATQWQRFRHITWPNLSNTLFFAIVLAIISMFQIFGIAWVFNRGGPYFATTTAVVRIYQVGFSNGNFGRASAMAVSLFVIIFFFSYYQYRLRRSEEVEY